MERFEDWKSIEFNEDGMTKYGWKCQHPKNLILGNGCDVGSFCYINAKYGVEIGKDAQIGSHCAIYSISTIDNKQGKVIIGENALIGSHSVIMPKVSVGNNAIIGACSFVNKDIPDNVVAYGVPAKVIRRLERSPRRAAIYRGNQRLPGRPGPKDWGS